MSCCLLFLIASRFASRGTSRNISRLNTNAPGLVLIWWLIEHYVTCIQVASVLSTICSTSNSLSGVLVRRMTRSTSPIVLCNRSQTVGSSLYLVLILFLLWASSVWNSCPTNSPPLSWTHLFGNGYRANQQFWNEYCFNNWKLSGNHGGFGEVGDEDISSKPFADFIQSNTSLLYLHEFVYQYPNIFRKL